MPRIPKILIADREPAGLPAFSEKIDLQFNCTFEHILTEEDLKSSLNNDSIVILVIDLNFSKSGETFTLISTLQESHPHLLIVPIIPAGQPQLLKPALDLDLFYFIHKPIDANETTLALKRAFESISTRQVQKKETNKQPPPPLSRNYRVK